MEHLLWSRRDRHALLLGFLLTLALLLAPLIFLNGPDKPDSAQPGLPLHQAEPSPLQDRNRTVKVLKPDGSVSTLTMADYLVGVVAAEMPASFQPEALKAQACAARTYTVLLQSKGGRHPGADICTDSTCCQAYITPEQAKANWGEHAAEYEEKIRSAVSETDGLGILYGGQPIQALFFSSAPGQTVDAVEVWGNAVDYLKCVKSPEGAEVPNYHTQVTLSPSKVQELTLASYPGCDLSGDPSLWFGTPQYSESGTVSRQELGGVPLTGGQLRKLFSLRSAAFSVTFDGENFQFHVTGHGHGVGMSQYGANAMAGDGAGFREILQWYYSGVEIAPLW